MHANDDCVYEFVQLLGRVFNILRENNPELSAERRRTIMRPPQVLREGTKKTVFVNFMDLCKTYAYISTCLGFLFVVGFNHPITVHGFDTCLLFISGSECDLYTNGNCFVAV